MMIYQKFGKMKEICYFNKKNTKMPFSYIQKQFYIITMLVFITLIEQDVIKLSKNINKLLMMHAIQFN